jgi:hypothetical protein
MPYKKVVVFIIQIKEIEKAEDGDLFFVSGFASEEENYIFSG